MDFELGLGYEELEIGQTASFTKTITETDVYLFAGISGDFNPMHVNEAFAQQTPFKTRIAHGALPQCLIAPVLGMKLPGLGTIAVEMSVRFKAPTYFGDTVTATATVAEKIAEKRRVRMDLRWTNQRGEVVATGRALVIPPMKALPPGIPETRGPQKETPHQPKEEKSMALTSVKEVFTKMTEVFNPSAAKTLNAVFQFVITGEGAGNWSVEIKNGTCEIKEATHPSPTVTLTMSGETWLAIVNKQTNGMMAFMSGKLKATGDIMLAQRINELFPV